MKDAMTDPANPNSGHGHVFPRPDRARARCGGPRLCRQCAGDLARAQSEAPALEPERSPDADDLVSTVDAVAPDAETPAELLGLTVGRAYGIAMAERDQAREVAEDLANTLGLAVTHLKATLTHLEAVGPSTFAATNDEADAARAFLMDLEAKAVGSVDQSPEQEPTT